MWMRSRSAKFKARLAKMRLLADRKQTILRSIEAQGKLTEKLAKQIQTATTTKRLEDLYLPYKPKKQTLATLARSRGLEELAREILEAAPACTDLDARARDFVNPDRQVPSGADALFGAGHILAEQFSEQADLRQRLREVLQRTGKIIRRALAATRPAAVNRRDARPRKRRRRRRRHGDAETVAAAAAVAEQTSQSPTGRSPPRWKLTGRAGRRAAGEEEAVLPVAESAAVEKPSMLPRPRRPLKRPNRLKSRNRPKRSKLLKSPRARRPSPPRPGRRHCRQPALRRSRRRQLRQPQPRRPKGEHGPKLSKKDLKKKRADEQKIKAFRDYFNFAEEVRKIPPHRTLAINRGERAKVLRVKIESDLAAMYAAVDEMLVPAEHPHADYLRGCARDSLARLILPGLEREIRRELTDHAELHAVGVFAKNLRNLLLQPPIRGRRVLAVDPGFKSGCKLAGLDEFGNMLAKR